MSRYDRFQELIDLDKLQNSEVIVVGCGTMGRAVVCDLAEHGVGSEEHGRMYLFDGDVVEERNFGFTAEDIGKPKVEVTAEYIRKLGSKEEPSFNVTYSIEMITHENIEKIVELCQFADLLVIAADDFEVMLELSDKAYDLCPVVMAFFGPRCDFGELIFSYPKQTPSIRKVFGKRNRTRIERPQALPIDCKLVTSFVSRVCLSILLQGCKGQELFESLHADATLCLIGIRPVWVFSNRLSDESMKVKFVSTGLAK